MELERRSRSRTFLAALRLLETIEVGQLLVGRLGLHPPDLSGIDGGHPNLLPLRALSLLLTFLGDGNPAILIWLLGEILNLLLLLSRN